MTSRGIRRPSAADLAASGYGANIDARYINRELSWLDFNERVLSLATTAQVPLLERFRFLAISGSNLDEFYQVRVAALHDQIAAEITEKSADGLTPHQQRRAISARAQRFAAAQERLLSHDLFPSLAREGTRVLRWARLGKRAKETLTADFENRIFPILTPLAVDPSHPFPYISNLALNLAVMVRDTDSGDERFARVKVPRNFPRFVSVPDSDDFILLED
ncbi:MAG: RNA degradosome polyphosphate kinase, partial [Actinomycetota bacterium]